jgi:hypothetical protein
LACIEATFASLGNLEFWHFFRLTVGFRKMLALNSSDYFFSGGIEIVGALGGSVFGAGGGSTWWRRCVG